MPKNTKYDLIIFDWDGTIANSAGIIVESIKEVCASEKLSTPSDHEVRSIIGLGLNEAFNKIFPNIKEKELQTFKTYIETHT